jgi:hypothetical protein
MEENSLTFLTSPKVTIATNTFVNVPVILKYEDTNLIEIVKEEGLGFTTEIPIYHQDGTYLAKAKGTRMYLTEDGKKAGLKIEKHQLLWVCTMNGHTLFEIQQSAGDAFKTSAELYTPDGYFVKCADMPQPTLIDTSGNAIRMGGVTMSGNWIQNCPVGIWIRKNGGFSMG